MIGQRMPSAYKGMTMQRIVASKLQTNPAGVNSTVGAYLSPAESKRNWNLQANLNAKTYGSFDQRTRVVLPMDTAKSQPGRNAEFRRQLAQPWESCFMHTPTDNQRLNNTQQTAFIKQRRLSAPNTYGSFYAFMHALSAAFGTLQG